MSISYSGTIPAPWIAKGVNEFGGDMNYIWNIVAPVIMSALRDGTLPRISREKLAGDGRSTKRAPGSAFDRDKLAADGVPFMVEHYGKEVPLPQELIALFSTIMDAQMMAGRKIRNDIFADAELRVKNLFFDTAVWTGSDLYTDNSAAPWATAATDIRNQVKDAKEKVRLNSGYTPNALILNQTQWLNMLNVNTDFKASVRPTAVDTPEVMRRTLSDLLELEIVVGDAVYNSAIEGQVYAGSYIWPATYAMVAKIAKTNDPTEAAVARSIAWSAMGSGVDMTTEIYREPQTKSQVVQGSMGLDEIVVDANFGHLMKIA